MEGSTCVSYTTRVEQYERAKEAHREDPSDLTSPLLARAERKLVEHPDHQKRLTQVSGFPADARAGMVDARVKTSIPCPSSAEKRVEDERRIADKGKGKASSAVSLGGEHVGRVKLQSIRNVGLGNVVSSVKGKNHLDGTVASLRSDYFDLSVLDDSRPPSKGLVIRSEKDTARVFGTGGSSGVSGGNVEGGRGEKGRKRRTVMAYTPRVEVPRSRAIYDIPQWDGPSTVVASLENDAKPRLAENLGCDTGGMLGSQLVHVRRLMYLMADLPKDDTQSAFDGGVSTVGYCLAHHGRGLVLALVDAMNETKGAKAASQIVCLDAILKLCGHVKEQLPLTEEAKTLTVYIDAKTIPYAQHLKKELHQAKKCVKRGRSKEVLEGHGLWAPLSDYEALSLEAERIVVQTVEDLESQAAGGTRVNITRLVHATQACVVALTVICHTSRPAPLSHLSLPQLTEIFQQVDGKRFYTCGAHKTSRSSGSVEISFNGVRVSRVVRAYLDHIRPAVVAHVQARKRTTQRHSRDTATVTLHAFLTRDGCGVNWGRAFEEFMKRVTKRLGMGPGEEGLRLSITAYRSAIATCVEELKAAGRLSAEDASVIHRADNHGEGIAVVEYAMTDKRQTQVRCSRLLRDVLKVGVGNNIAGGTTQGVVGAVASFEPPRVGRQSPRPVVAGSGITGDGVPFGLCVAGGDGLVDSPKTGSSHPRVSGRLQKWSSVEISSPISSSMVGGGSDRLIPPVQGSRLPFAGEIPTVGVARSLGSASCDGASVGSPLGSPSGLVTSSQDLESRGSLFHSRTDSPPRPVPPSQVRTSQDSTSVSRVSSAAEGVLPRVAIVDGCSSHGSVSDPPTLKLPPSVSATAGVGARASLGHTTSRVEGPAPAAAVLESGNFLGVTSLPPVVPSSQGRSSPGMSNPSRFVLARPDTASSSVASTGIAGVTSASARRPVGAGVRTLGVPHVEGAEPEEADDISLAEIVLARHNAGKGKVGEAVVGGWEPVTSGGSGSVTHLPGVRKTAKVVEPSFHSQVPLTGEVTKYYKGFLPSIPPETPSSNPERNAYTNTESFYIRLAWQAEKSAKRVGYKLHQNYHKLIRDATNAKKGDALYNVFGTKHLDAKNMADHAQSAKKMYDWEGKHTAEGRAHTLRELRVRLSEKARQQKYEAAAAKAKAKRATEERDSAREASLTKAALKIAKKPKATTSKRYAGFSEARDKAMMKKRR